jgi:hypothetical protein
MKDRKERLGRKARVRADVLHAHLEWAAKRWPDYAARLKPHLGAEALALVEGPPRGESATVLFSQLVRIDQAIAAAAGGDPQAIYHALGEHSAEHNLKDVYQDYRPEQPHEFFKSMSTLHRAFQDFGKSRYESRGERSGRISITRYREYSPVFCLSGRGYYEQALRMLKVPGPVVVEEIACHCAGDAACVFELSW